LLSVAENEIPMKSGTVCGYAASLNVVNSILENNIAIEWHHD